MSVIFVYHSVTDRVEHPWLQIHPQNLAIQLDQVTELGYRWVPLEEAADRPMERLAALTFDDGMADFLNAVDILQSRSIPTVQYVCPGLVGTTTSWMTKPSQRSRPLLSVDELRDLAHQGLEIGCHGWTHTPFPDLPIEQLTDELQRCIRWFTEELGIPARSLAYPYGRCDVRRANLVGDHYELALAVEGIDGVPPRLALPRLCGADRMDRRALAHQMARYDLAGFMPADDRGTSTPSRPRTKTRRRASS